MVNFQRLRFFFFLAKHRFVLLNEAIQLIRVLEVKLLVSGRGDIFKLVKNFIDVDYSFHPVAVLYVDLYARLLGFFIYEVTV